ncbi:hypothetical protein CEXT_156861 [Caerostris extrusa]|uniref:Uncharacterized protein n=1 Tax=Caerostris extrusa TaxID=172846 RepID=A0AAV4MDK2_CAEEX|nr:hypothetical protein CEXT_156861 [Caerostris extrusa]
MWKRHNPVGEKGKASFAVELSEVQWLLIRRLSQTVKMSCKEGFLKAKHISASVSRSVFEVAGKLDVECEKWIALLFVIFYVKRG